MITIAVICAVLAFFAGLLWPSPGPALILAAVGLLSLAARFLP